MPVKNILSSVWLKFKRKNVGINNKAVMIMTLIGADFVNISKAKGMITTKAVIEFLLIRANRKKKGTSNTNLQFDLAALIAIKSAERLKINPKISSLFLILQTTSV